MKITNNNTVTALTIFILGVFITSCSDSLEVEETTLLQKIEVTNEDTTDGSQKTQGDPHGGKYFSHTDSSNAYGSTITYAIPDSLLQKTIRIKLNMWVRQGDFNEKNQYAVSLQSSQNEIVNWSQILMKDHIKETHKWVNVQDSITIPGNLINKTGLSIRMFPYNSQGTSFMDNDDIEISILKVENKILE